MHPRFRRGMPSLAEQLSTFDESYVLYPGKEGEGGKCMEKTGETNPPTGAHIPCCEMLGQAILDPACREPTSGVNIGMRNHG
jgi:hypothetical protein